MIVQHNPVTTQTPCQCQQLARPAGMGAITLPQFQIGGYTFDWKWIAIGALALYVAYRLLNRGGAKSASRRQRRLIQARAAYDLAKV